MLLVRSRETRRIGAVCGGIYGVAPTGLLDGREVTTHWRLAGDVARRFPRLKVGHKRALVQDGPCYTSTGLSAGVNLSLALFEMITARTWRKSARAKCISTRRRWNLKIFRSG